MEKRDGKEKCSHYGWLEFSSQRTLGARAEHTFWSYPSRGVRELGYLYPKSCSLLVEGNWEVRVGKVSSPALQACRAGGQRKLWSSQKTLRQINARTAVEGRPGCNKVVRTRGSGQGTNIICYNHPSATKVRGCGQCWPKDRKRESAFLTPGTLPLKAKLGSLPRVLK